MSLVKRSVMTLYSGALDPYSHQVRIVLAEKGVAVDIIDVDENSPCDELLDLNPYNTLPTLLDRELVLYHPRVIMEYLDERFPHPPLLSVYPVNRAKSRLMMYRIERDWYSLMKLILNGSPDESDSSRVELQEGLLALAPVFADKPFFLNDEFSLVDCYIAPLLWRLPQLGIELSSEGDPVLEYANRMFMRSSFQESLSDLERDIREDDDID